MKAIIIDDEPDCTKLLALKLTKHCPHIEIVAICLQSEEGLQAIKKHKPQLVFLDIEMPRMNGFQLLNNLDEITFALIFTTAYNQFAVRAFRYSAIDYLLKPIVVEELIAAVQKVDKYVATHITQINHLQHQMKDTKSPLAEMAVLSQFGLSFMQLNELIYCESNNNVTNLYLSNGQCLALSRTIAELQDLLEPFHFLRIHRQYIVNLNQIKKFVKADNSVVLLGGQTIPVARSQKEKLMEKFDWL